MSRLLWLGNPLWAGSGYGGQAALFIPRLQADGHDVAMMCNWGMQGSKFDYRGVTVYPSDGAWGNIALPTYVDHHKADKVIALCDAFVLNPNEWRDGLTAAVWTPIDHYPIPPPVLQTLQSDKITPIAMSRFGEEWMHKFDLDPLYIPHGVDTAIFRPRPEIKYDVREELGIPRDCFLAGMVAANRGKIVHRKAFPQALQAWSIFAKKHPDAVLYAHTEANAPSGMSLDVLATAVGCPPGSVRFPEDEIWHLGLGSDTVASIYQAFDVLLMPSMGEGFGVPLVEAQACGVPVIASNHSAMSELTQAGWLVGGEPWWDDAAKSFFINPSIPQIADALEAAYEHSGDEKLKAGAVAFAQQYHADTVYETYWRPALEQMGLISRQVRRARERKAEKAAAA